MRGLLSNLPEVGNLREVIGDDHFHEECGVFGIYYPGEDVARLSFFALYALQHRGQESAGIAVSDGSMAYIHKGMGLVAQVFNEDVLQPMQGNLAIAHTRYSTTGGSKLRNAQPYLIETALGPLGVGHNGNLVNAPMLRRDLLQRGVGLMSSSDSEIITQMIAGAAGDWEARIRGFMEQAQGAYCLTILTRNAVYGVRDPWGFRPLVIGKMNGKGYCIASESCALATIGAQFEREVEPGEIVRLDENGLHTERGAPLQARKLCTFEHIYFSRPDSIFDGKVIHDVRQALGRELAREAPADADVVVAVPDSGTPHAIGYALQSGIPFSEGLIKNRYIGRTFIQPNERLRREGVHLKYNPLISNLRGRRIVLVDDSIVRGSTSGPLVRLLRDAGAAEVHVRVASPPILHSCFMGVDMARDQDLIAAVKSVEEIRQHIGADTLAYLSLDGMMKAVGATDGYCNACFTGVYPPGLLNEQPEKMVFEGVFG
jgi:amidophosphoribosyltransferase